MDDSPSSYRLFPFRFDHRSDGRYFVSNEAGEFLFLPDEVFQQFINHALDRKSMYYADLKARHFLADRTSSALFDLYASKYRTKKSFIEGFTKLHMFVPTLRCNQGCLYCQVSRQGAGADARHYDMSEAVLARSVRMMLAAPAPHLTMEFQGGEPLLRFDLVKEGILLAEGLRARAGKQMDYVVCTNLNLINDEQLDFFRQHGVLISTSLDGPAELHDKLRPYSRNVSGHACVTRNIRRAQEALGKEAVAALMTTARESLHYSRAIVDEYLRMDLGSIFIRELNPYGFAAKRAEALAYSTSEFVEFYRGILEYIIGLNRTGETFSESYAAMILTKLLTPWPIGFVDLQSPSGAGIGAALYNYNGDVYASDEARMLGETGDATFRLGNVLEDSYEGLFFGSTMQAIAEASCNEALAGCADCAYQVYCGADPIRNYRSDGDIFGMRPSGRYCEKNIAIIRQLIDIVDSADADTERVLWSWITRRSGTTLMRRRCV